jgi:periplasmic protein TonB
MPERIPPSADQDMEVAYAYQPVHSLDARLLVGIALTVPLLVAAGVYLLHNTHDQPLQQQGGPVVEVRLMENPAPSNASAMERLQLDESAELATLPVEEPAETVPNPAESPTEEPLPETKLEPRLEDIEEMPLPPKGRSAHISAVAAPKEMPNAVASAFQRELVQHIERYRRGVKTAGGRLNGRPVIRFEMRRDGTVIGIWVASSSGQFLVDEAAVDTIRRAQPLPKIPLELPDSMTMRVALRYE